MTRIVLGPPGTGKTTTLIGMVEDALGRGVPPDRIGYFSFTRKAAHEAMNRACAKFNLKPKEFPYFSTLHSMCFRQLGMKRGDVLEGSRLQEFAKFARITISGRWSEDGTLSGFDLGDRILFMENLSRIRCISLEEQYRQNSDNLPWNVVSRVAKELAVFKAEYGLMDFTDMISEYVKSGIRLGLEEVMIDESQDLSQLQWRAVRKLRDGTRMDAVAGDDDQAIYRWAGADVDHLIEMEGDARVLGQSFRVPPVIQSVALNVIEGVRKRRSKTWSARSGEDGFVENLPKFQDVDCGEGQILVLARNAYIIREQIEPWLRHSGIVYERNNSPSISAKVLRAIYAWEALRKGRTVSVEDARVVYDQMSADDHIKRGFKKLPQFEDDAEVTIGDLRECGGLLTEDAPWFVSLDKIPGEDKNYIRVAVERGEKLREKPRVTVSTIHGAKGGEADHVVLMKEIAGRTALEMDRYPDDEARVCYVGVTRAKRKLSIVASQNGRELPGLQSIGEGS